MGNEYGVDEHFMAVELESGRRTVLTVRSATDRSFGSRVPDTPVDDYLLRVPGMAWAARS